MRWTKKVSDSIKKGIRSWLNILPSSPYSIQINEVMDFETNAIRNRIWYRGDGNELEQMYSQVAEYADKHKFWSSRCSKGMEMRKIHTGLPSLMVRTLNSIIVSSMKDFKFENGEQENIWKEIEKENKFRKKFEKSLKETLVIGDGAYKITFDTTISQYPILEWYSGERIEIILQRDRLKEVIFKTPYREKSQMYVLHEHYGYGYIKNHLYRGEEEVPLNSIDATAAITDWTFDNKLILAVPLQIYESSKYEGRGGSIFDGKLDSFDALDEAWSQWMDALRAGRAKTYVPDCLVPRDPNTGKIIPPNPFDMRYLAADGDQREGQKNVISTDQPTIPHESYLASYVTALDLCLQGVLSPSTLGIDVKKLDNAEAQREKEKTTLYTRNAIIEALQETIPELVSACINAYRILLKKAPEEVKVEVTFGEYANPSFESQVETMAKARPSSPIMSVEAQVDELYRDNKEQKWKDEEVARLKAEMGIQTLEEPSVSMSAGEFQVDVEDDYESQGRKENVPDAEKGVSGTPSDSKGTGSAGNLRAGTK